MNYYFAYQQVIASTKQIPSLLETSKKDAKIYIEESKIDLSQKKTTKMYRMGVNADYFGESNKACLDWKNMVSFEAIGGEKLLVDSKITNQKVLDLFLLHEALGMILFQQGLFVLHSSAVKISDNRAIAFIGRSGAGKSTTAAAFAQAGYPILNDEILAIRFDEQGKPFVLPAFPLLRILENSVKGLNLDEEVSPLYQNSSKFAYLQTKESFPTEPIPLTDIFILQKPNSKFHNISVPPGRFAIELLRHFPLPPQMLFGKPLAKHFQDCLNLTKHISLKKIRRPRDFAALQKFVQEVVAEKQ